MSESCTTPGVVPSSRAIAGSAGMYMSVANGETPTISASGTIGGSTAPAVGRVPLRSVVTRATLRASDRFDSVTAAGGW
ncbi:hypothetical protein GCM10017712_28790 [Curtobacterium citreum]